MKEAQAESDATGVLAEAAWTVEGVAGAVVLGADETLGDVGSAEWGAVCGGRFRRKGVVSWSMGGALA